MSDLRPGTTRPRAVTVLGAGMVGVSCALELQRRGCTVTLVDRQFPVRETSYGNAGVLARSSLIPFNNPTLWPALPRYLSNRSAALRYNPWFALRNLGWGLRFLANARRTASEQTIGALNGLITHSGSLHTHWLREAGVHDRLRDNGWLFLYRTANAFENSAWARATYARFGIATDLLDREALQALEPHVKPVFERALWIKDSSSVNNPGQIVEAYRRLFAERGGTVVERTITHIRPVESSRWKVHCAGADTLEAPAVVVALGPWSNTLLEPLGLAVPMAFERGYHTHFAPQGAATLGRPVYDTAGAYVLSPMDTGLRLTTGVELNSLDAPARSTQLDLAEKSAREAFPLAAREPQLAWMGRRPTLPDSRPVIGEVTGHRGLWLAFGHQHVGFSTGPGTASLLAALMLGGPMPLDAAPFSPARFLG